MSWSVSVSSVAAENAIGALQDNFTNSYPEPTAEVKEQFAAAVEALRAALPTVQPDQLGLVSVSANGHANPGHHKASGWANDSLSVSVYQVG